MWRFLVTEGKIVFFLILLFGYTEESLSMNLDTSIPDKDLNRIRTKSFLLNVQIKENSKTILIKL